MNLRFTFSVIALEKISHFRRGITVDSVREDLFISHDLLETKKRHSRLMIEMNSLIWIKRVRRRLTDVGYSIIEKMTRHLRMIERQKWTVNKTLPKRQEKREWQSCTPSVRSSHRWEVRRLDWKPSGISNPYCTDSETFPRERDDRKHRERHRFSILQSARWADLLSSRSFGSLGHSHFASECLRTTG